MSRAHPLSLGALCAGLLVSSVASAQSEEEDLEIEVGPGAAPAPIEPEPIDPDVPSAPAPSFSQGGTAASEPTEVTELRATLAALEARLAALESAPAPAPAPAPVPEPPAAPPKRWFEDLRLKVSGYVQPQLQFNQLSEDELSPDGGTLNQDRFLVRRGRIEVDGSTRYTRVNLEVDANTTYGPAVTVKNAFGQVFLPNEGQPGRPACVAVTGGLFDVPFGFEIPQNSEDRIFVERTRASRALFPAETDVGAQLSGGLGPIRYAVALQNGVPLNPDPSADNTVYSHEQTLVGRVGFEVRDETAYELSGGASLLDGTGFRAGSPDTKSALGWRDTNQDGLITLNELVPVASQAATPSLTFERWGVGGDLQLGLKTPLGWTRVYVEATMATNLDRGFYVADPISTGYALREVGFSVGGIQEITEYGLVGFRGESYDPNADQVEQRRGEFVPHDATISTLSPIVGVQLPERARLVLQYDYVADHLARDESGLPKDLTNDQWTLRLQVEY